MANTNHAEKGMVLSGDNDTLVYTRNERNPRSSKRKRGRLPGTRERQKNDQGNEVEQTKKSFQEDQSRNPTYQ